MSGEQPGRVFQGALVASFALLVYMFLPFVTVLLAALVLAVVSWPLHARLAARIGAIPSAVLTVLGLSGVVLVPLALLAWLGLREAWSAVQDLVAWVEAGGLDEALRSLEDRLSVAPSLRARLGETLAERLGDGLQQAVEAAAKGAGRWVTGAVGALAEGSVQLVVGIATWIGLYVEGPRLLAAIRRLGLMSEAYVDRLFERFQQFARSVIVGMLATAGSQGIVAALGFWLVGAERVVLLGVMTALLSQIPLVGSAVVWGPVAIAMVAEGRYVAAVFVAVWSLLLTASVDNLLKPLVYHGGLDIHPVLVLLSILAGMTSFGPAGVLVGPFLLVLFVTLWTLYDRDVLGRP